MSDYEMKPKGGGRGMAWHEVWAKVLSNPSIASFESILRYSSVSIVRALLWLYVSGVICFFGLIVVIQVLEGGIILETLPTVGILSLMYGGIFTATTAVNALCIHGVALVLGGRGSYTSLLYSFAAFMSPLLFIQLAVSLLTGHWLFALVLQLYRSILSGAAVQAVHRFEGWKVALALIIGGALASMVIGAVF